MKEIKFILQCLAVALYTSSWWAASIWGKPETVTESKDIIQEEIQRMKEIYNYTKKI